MKCMRSIATIYLSRSACVYENLAFEEWIFRKHNLERDGEALLLWSNEPAVVIGRYQNPYIEANLRYCQENSIRIARRHSGGGTVYHDLGNLNLSFLTSQARHCRPRNLRLLAESINLHFDNESLVQPNERDDLVFASSGCKISGTAARISHGRAYHHFTLLVDVLIDVLKASLNSNLKDKIETNATKSVKAKSVGYLTQKRVGPPLNVDEMRRIAMNAFTSQFTHINVVNFRWSERHAYAGLDAIRDLLCDEVWIFDRTPPFIFNLDGEDGGTRVLINRSGRVTESRHNMFPVGKSFYRSLLQSRYF